MNLGECYGPAMAKLVRGDLASFIDHTALDPTLGGERIDRLCDEVAEFGFASACIASRWVARAHKRLGNQGRVCSVVGFPHGDSSWRAKVAETRQAVSEGAVEIDMVVAFGALIHGEDDAVFREIEAVVRAAEGAVVKVILETARLTHPQLLRGCQLTKDAGAGFVKTSTGFGPGGATVEVVAAMRAAVGPEMGVKASGGVRSAADADAMILAGATRLGASSGVIIVSGGTTDGSYG
ncbi:MAG: deoxyribose-phosphate aldolase [Polyangiales bacterium]